MRRVHGVHFPPCARLQFLMEWKGLSVEELSEKSTVPADTIRTYIEKKTAVLPWDGILLSRALDVKQSKLMDITSFICVSISAGTDKVNELRAAFKEARECVRLKRDAAAASGRLLDAITEVRRQVGSLQQEVWDRYRDLIAPYCDGIGKAKIKLANTERFLLDVALSLVTFIDRHR